MHKILAAGVNVIENMKIDKILNMVRDTILLQLGAG